MIPIPIFLCFAGCRSYHTLEGKAKPIYISTTEGIPQDSLEDVTKVVYATLQGLKGDLVEVTELRGKEKNKSLIHEPTLFYYHSSRFIAYPNERITIKGSNDSPIIVTSRGSKQRDNELIFFQTFDKMQKYPYLSEYILDSSLDTILKLEQIQKDQIVKANVAGKILFDSLAQAFKISSKFREVAETYAKNMYDMSLIQLYRRYKDTLVANNLYSNKLRALIPAFNVIIERSSFNSNVRSCLNEVIRELFPGNHMWSLHNTEEFKRCFDSVAENFTGLSRDYLLSRIMYRANSLGVAVPSEYDRQYKEYSGNFTYRKIVKNALKERRKNMKDRKGLPNQLLTASDNKQVHLEDILAQHRGKLVLVDFWASWCIPCLQEVPYLKKLIQKYSQDQISFIAISLDRETASWRETIALKDLKEAKNYLLLNASKTSFYKQYKLTTIPRYLLIGKDGQVINADAPAPSDTSLAELIDKLLTSK